MPELWKGNHDFNWRPKDITFFSNAIIVNRNGTLIRLESSGDGCSLRKNGLYIDMTKDSKKVGVYWMTNKNWYHENPDGSLTVNDTAPEEAKRSYEKWIKHQEEMLDEENLFEWDECEEAKFEEHAKMIQSMTDEEFETYVAEQRKIQEKG